MGHIEVGDGIDVPSSQITILFPNVQRTEETEKSKEQIANPRAKIKHIRRGEDKQPVRFQNSKNFSEGLSVMFDVFDYFGARDEVKCGIGVRHRFRIEIDDVDRNIFGAH